MVIGVALAGAVWAAGERERLEAEQRRLELALAETRVRLLREDAELRALHDRITSLQRALARKLDERPEMQAYRRKLESVQAQLAGER